MKTDIDRRIREKVFKKYNGRCAYCGIKLKRYTPNGSKQRRMFAVDHIIPNGDNGLNNLNPVCKICNSTKRNKTMQEFKELLKYKKAKIEKFTDNQILFLNYNNIDVEQLLRNTISDGQEFLFYFEKVRRNKCHS